MAREEHPQAKAVREREEVKNQQVREFYEREAQLRPTPSQAENDAAKVGIPVELEPDGSEPEEEVQRRMLESRIPGANPYVTRDTTADADAPRRRGRPPAGDKPAE